MTEQFGLSTDRLILRRMREDDLHGLLQYRNDPLITKYDGMDSVTEDEARDFITAVSSGPLAVPGEWCQIAIELRGEGIIGDIGFCVNGERPYMAEIGYRLNRRFWGKGYASEAVGAVLDWAFGPLGLHRVIAQIDTRNDGSIGLVERLGFRREGTFLAAYQEPDGWSDEYLYAMLDEEWARQRRR
jgi:RimJ/RimL family protein N-acetyltransferase